MRLRAKRLVEILDALSERDFTGVPRETVPSSIGGIKDRGHIRRGSRSRTCLRAIWKDRSAELSGFVKSGPYWNPYYGRI